MFYLRLLSVFLRLQLKEVSRRLSAYVSYVLAVEARPVCPEYGQWSLLGHSLDVTADQYLASSHRHWLPVSDPHTHISDLRPLCRSGHWCLAQAGVTMAWPEKKQKLLECLVLVDLK